ncbi:class I SAM-dependent methyltransferase [Thiovibrio sp. JS02]
MPEKFEKESARIRDSYARRDASGKTEYYTWTRPDVLLTQYRRLEAIVDLLQTMGWKNFAGKDCLDVGCGSGAWLRTLQEWGGDPDRLHGVDLLSDRIEKALSLSPHIDFRLSAGWFLPFGDLSMDLVSAQTVFSSILDHNAQAALAKEMVRVLRPGGLLMVYDFWISNPRNVDTVGIDIVRMKSLFPNMPVHWKKVTLAPPLQRPIARLSPLVAHLLEAVFPFLRSHAVYLFQKTGEVD